MLAGTVWRLFFVFNFPCHPHGSNAFGFVPPLLQEAQSSLSLNPQLWPGPLPGRRKGSPWSLAVSIPAGRTQRDHSVPTFSQRLPCPWLKVLLVPTFAKAHPDPKPSCVGAAQAATHPRGAEGANPALCTGCCFLLSFWRRRRPGPTAPLPGPVGVCPGHGCPCARHRGEEGAGGEGGDPGGCRPSSRLCHSAFLIKI